MKVYLLTAFFVLIFAYLAKNQDMYSEKLTTSGKIVHTSGAKFFLFLICALLICVAGLRYYVGTDFGGYYKHYQQYADNVVVSLRTFDEPGYGIISVVSKWLGATDGGLAVFLASAITIGIVLVTIFRNTDEVEYAVLLYLFMGGWIASFNAVRQSLAAAFVFAGYRWLREKKLLRFAVCVLIAFLCHKSALLMIAMYFILHRKINILNILITAVGAYVALQSYDALFSLAGDVLDKNYSFSNTYLTNSVNILRIMVGVAPALYFVISTWKKEKTDIEEFHLNVLILHATLNIVTMNSTYLARMALYTAPFVVLSISELSKTINAKYKKVIMIVIILLYFLFWMYELSVSSALNHFRFIWQK